VAEKLTAEFGKGHWSLAGTERGVLLGIRDAGVFVARDEGRLIASVTLSTKKPWAIDKSYFQTSRKPLYLTSMAIDPALQGRGLGRECLARTLRIAREWPSDAVRLDAYDTAAGAGEFYRKSGFTEVGRVVYRDTPLIYYEMLL